ncbi:MAG TPA: Vms1/Ankzf1 family peptidyl-tRNA hydrolase [Nocardioidaceae bacterium]|nr:Vms1/Ankzf1 family peptidyl-tRNA hydrolase [Nocardioidaceae bacterium]
MAVLDQQIDRHMLEAVLRTGEPVAAVYLGAAPDVTNEYQLQWDTRWRPLATRLREQGADEGTVAALEAAVAAPVTTRAARGSGHVAAFAQDGRVLALVSLPDLPGPDLAHYAAPGHVLPLLMWKQERPPYVLVVIDRTGADLESSIGMASLPVRSTVEGPDDEIERNAPGGWEGLTQGRYQRRAEDSWAHNAAAAAEAVASALQRTEARVLVVAGDVRAVQLLMERLPTWVHKDVTVKRVSGSRAADGSQRTRSDVVASVVREACEEQTAALWQRFLEERTPNGLAVEGVHSTLAALALGRVATLLISADADASGEQAWMGHAPTEVQPTDRPEPPWTGARRGALADVAVRAAILTGAQVRVIPAGAGFGPERGVGAICRHH